MKILILKKERIITTTLPNTIYGDFNQVTVEEVEGLMQGNTSGRVVR